jgi:integration host factor subunit beta
MVKHDLAEELLEAFPGITRQDMLMVVDTLFESMADALVRGEVIDIRGIGRLKVKKRRPIQGRNPKTAAHVDIPTRWVTHFKPADSLTKRINAAIHT